MRLLIMSHLIWIYTACQYVFIIIILDWNPIYMSKYMDEST